MNKFCLVLFSSCKCVLFESFNDLLAYLFSYFLENGYEDYGVYTLVQTDI
uniref:Uncharacterized protein n=1 Tax=Dulem virus 71 TaxID=3145782 RepID=A0AAU8AYM8_9VIRU